MEHKNKNDVSANPWLNFSENLYKYKTPSLKKSIFQIANTFIPYVALWLLLIYSLSVSYWLTGFLMVLAAGFLVRLFIIFHDCGHGSFFKSTTANRIVGIFFGILAFTPYDKWHKMHLHHHATVGNLDKRGMGDVWTMTRKEFESGSRLKKLEYRLYRNPFVMFGIGSLYVFLIQNRLTRKWMTKKEKLNVYFTKLRFVDFFIIMGLTIGFLPFIVLQLGILYIAAIAGLWLFYLQHQYEEVAWYSNDKWNFRKVAMEGSSFVKFPKLLQWFSGNIGFHHIHHVNATIPNYNLETCYKENEIFNTVKPVKFLASLRTLRLRLWDEDLQKLVSFKQLAKS